MITGPPRILAPLRHRDYRLLATGSLVSLLGDGFFLVAIALQVLAISDDNPAAISLVGIAWTGSALLTYLVGGWASDLFDRRRIMIAADLLRAAAIGGIGVLSVGGALELWHVLVLGACFGAGNAFFNPSATAIVPDLLPAEELPQANAFLAMARPAMVRLAGPAIGGFVIAATEPGVAFLVDAATFLVSAALLALIRTSHTPAMDGEPARPPLRLVAEGFSFVRANPWCGAWLAGAALSLLAYYGPVEVLLPYILKVELGLGDGAASQLGLILAIGGLGSIVASVAVGQRPELPRRFVTAMYLCEAAAILTIAVYGLMTQLWQAMAASFVIHGLFAFTEVVWITMLQRFVPRRLLGRVASLDWLMSIGLMPLSFALAGTLTRWFSAGAIIVAAAVTGATVLVGLLFVPGVRAPERTPVPDGADHDDPVLAG
ncbi:tetracycline efflux MFS transporter Tet(V) [soil metagenome]